MSARVVSEEEKASSHILYKLKRRTQCIQAQKFLSHTVECHLTSEEDGGRRRTLPVAASLFKLRVSVTVNLLVARHDLDISAATKVITNREVISREMRNVLPM